MEQVLSASIEARLQYLAAIRRLLEEQDALKRSGHYDYGIDGVVERLKRAIKGETIGWA